MKNYPVVLPIFSERLDGPSIFEFIEIFNHLKSKYNWSERLACIRITSVLSRPIYLKYIRNGTYCQSESILEFLVKIYSDCYFTDFEKQFFGH